MMRLKRYFLHFSVLTLVVCVSSCRKASPEVDCTKTSEMSDGSIQIFINTFSNLDSLKYYHYKNEIFVDSVLYVKTGSIQDAEISYFYSLEDGDNCIHRSNKMRLQGKVKTYTNVLDLNDSFNVYAFQRYASLFFSTFNRYSQGLLSIGTSLHNQIFDYLHYSIDSLARFQSVTTPFYLKDGLLNTYVEKEHVTYVKNSLPYVVQYTEGEDRHTYVLQ